MWAAVSLQKIALRDLESIVLSMRNLDPVHLEHATYLFEDQAFIRVRTPFFNQWSRALPSIASKISAHDVDVYLPLRFPDAGSYTLSGTDVILVAVPTKDDIRGKRHLTGTLTASMVDLLDLSGSTRELNCVAVPLRSSSDCASGAGAASRWCCEEEDRVA